MKLLKLLTLKNLFLTAIFGAVIVACANGLAPGMSSLSFQGTTPNALSMSRGISSLHAAVEPVTLTVLNRDGSTAGTLKISDARLALKEIKILLANQTDAEAEDEGNIKFKGPYVVDLLANTVTPVPPSVRVEAGSYRRVEVKLHKVRGDEENAEFGSAVPSSDPLYGHSLYIAGTYSGQTADGQVTDMPFSLSLDDDEKFVMEGGSEALVISATEPNPVLVAFRMAKWVMFDNGDVNDKNVDFAEVSPENSAIQLDNDSSGTNQKIWQVFRAAFRQSADFGKDTNEDGVLQVGEDDDAEADDEAD